jgi:hypothetical protein
MGLERSSRPVLVTNTDILENSTQSCRAWQKLLQKTFWQKEANLWHEVASSDLRSL